MHTIEFYFDCSSPWTVPAKARYYQKDLQDWARHAGLTIGQPPVFPVNSVKVMRGAFVADALIRRVGEQACKDRLRDTTDELIARGGFGSPTMFLDGDDMYFGNDRIPLILAKLD